MRLTIELVPTPLWGMNVRSRITEAQWDRIRYQVYLDYNNSCGVCGRTKGTETKSLNCHEIWEYNDETHIQTLVGFIALCDLCHHMKHLGQLKRMLVENPGNYLNLKEEVIANFPEINQCTKKGFEECRLKAIALHIIRSKHEWNQDISYAGKFLQEAYRKAVDRDLHRVGNGRMKVLRPLFHQYAIAKEAGKEVALIPRKVGGEVLKT